MSNLGWECPKCGKVHNPVVLECGCNFPLASPDDLGYDPNSTTLGAYPSSYTLTCNYFGGMGV